MAVAVGPLVDVLVGIVVGSLVGSIVGVLAGVDVSFCALAGSAAFATGVSAIIKRIMTSRIDAVRPG